MIVVEDVGFLVFVFVLVWIGVFVKCGVVEVFQGLVVFGKVVGNLIYDDFDVGLMQFIDEVMQVVGRFVVVGGREVFGDLVFLGGSEWVFS